MPRFLSNNIVEKTLKYWKYKYSISEINRFELENLKQQCLPQIWVFKDTLKSKTTKI